MWPKRLDMIVKNSPINCRSATAPLGLQEMSPGVPQGCMPIPLLFKMHDNRQHIKFGGKKCIQLAKNDEAPIRKTKCVQINFDCYNKERVHLTEEWC